MKNSGYNIIGKLKEIYDHDIIGNEEYAKKHSFEDYLQYNFDNDRNYQEFKKEYQKLLQDFHREFKVSLRTREFFDTYPILGNYKYNLIKHLKQIEESRFKMTYKVKFMSERPEYDDNGKIVSRGKLTDLYYRTLPQVAGSDTKSFPV